MDIKLYNKLKRNIVLDYINTFITNLNMQSSVWVLYLAYCGLSIAETGIVEGIYHATSIIFEIPSGICLEEKGAWCLEGFVLLFHVLLCCFQEVSGTLH